MKLYQDRYGLTNLDSHWHEVTFARLALFWELPVIPCAYMESLKRAHLPALPCDYRKDLDSEAVCKMRKMEMKYSGGVVLR